ncbi:MAG: EAL domain-containing protein [Acidimicrobiia bacterium]|nr:EAL domain-containing protein [Acidimicrobiia bacterium]
MTLAFVVTTARARTIADAQESAVAVAEDHFRDFVADHEHRGLAVSEAYERVLVGAVMGVDSPVSPTEIERRLELLNAEALPGSVAFFVVSAGADPIRIGNDSQWSLQPVEIWPAGLWATVPETSENMVVVGYTTTEGDSVLAVATISGLVDLSVPGEDDGHVVDIILTPQFAAPDGNLVLVEDPAGASEPARRHLDVDEPQQEPPAFVSSREITMFDHPWLIEIRAADSFLEIPTSREIIVLRGVGLLVSFSLFGLLHFLVRRVAAESRHRNAEARARAANERFAASFHSSPIGCALLTADGEVIEVNRALEELLNRPGRDLTNISMADLVAEPMRAQWTARLLRLSDNRELRTRAEVRYEPDSDRHIWVDETATIVLDGEEHRILLQMSDVTEQRSAKEELQRLALRDDLTGLANRTLLEDRLDHALLRIRRDKSIAAVLFMDVDQFKMVNDTMGHGAGDRLLTALADRLQSVVRDHDTIARFGGDEFVMLCEDLSTQTEARQISDRIQAEVTRPFDIDDRTIAVTLSIGIAVCGPDDDAEAVLRDADLAMYQAKQLGRNRAVLFEREMRENLIEQLQLEDELARAIQKGELELHYQPLITTNGGDICGFEALSRWNHPSHGLLGPGAFLPTATQLGLMPTIDTWALETAARQLVSWSQTRPEASNWTMAVNASAENFGDPDFARRVEDAIARAGADPQRLTIEITEDAILANTDTAVQIIRQLRQLGLRIAIDDFGTGYSSLSQLAALDIDVLKIDKSFMTDLHRSPSNEIVRAVVQMAQALGIPTVAEGVECEQDLAELQQIGATQAQGYLISKPLTAEQATALIATHRTARGSSGTVARSV